MYNLEKIAGKQHWTGYAPLSGVWHVTKHGKGKGAQWFARCVTGRSVGIGAFWCRTLREVSQELNSH